MRISVLVGSAFLLSAGLGFGHEGEPSRYNYRDHVRPIFVKHCAGCHRPGGVAPMSLLDYQEAVPWANAMKLQVLGLQMPPWLPVEGVSELRHARTLTAEEIDILVDWAVGQTPQGEPLTAEEIAATGIDAPEASELDLVLEPAADIVVAEDEYEKLHCLVLSTELDEPRVATGFDVLPQNASVLRRATIFRGGACEGGEPLATWLPDQRGVGFAEGWGAALAADGQLAVELHYVKGWNDEGKRLTDRPRIGIRLSDDATLVTTQRVDGGSYRLPASASLVALYPARESGGGDEPLRVEARLPDGSAETLLLIEEFDPTWREKYVLAKPIALPAGAEIRASQSAVWVDLVIAAPAAGE